MEKSTHYGECQVCGCQQKLPGGVLAKHGYTTRWGFFEGVCAGADYKPFEQDKEQAELRVKWADAEVRGLRAQAAEVRKPTAGPKAWVREYVPAQRRGDQSDYKWREVEVRAIRKQIGELVWIEYTFTRLDGREESLNRQCSLPKDSLASVCTYLNGLRADAIEKRAKDVLSYIKWQRERCAAWKPKPLKLVEAAVRPIVVGYWVDVVWSDGTTGKATVAHDDGIASPLVFVDRLQSTGKSIRRFFRWDRTTKKVRSVPYRAQADFARRYADVEKGVQS